MGARHGHDKMYRTRWGEWRTRVRNRRCVFLENNVCSIHDDPAYPAVCRGFPWVDAETGDSYEFDQTICPEFTAWPGLVAMAEGSADQLVAVKRGHRRWRTGHEVAD